MTRRGRGGERVADFGRGLDHVRARAVHIIPCRAPPFVASRTHDPGMPFRSSRDTAGARTAPACSPSVACSGRGKSRSGDRTRRSAAAAGRRRSSVRRCRRRRAGLQRLEIADMCRARAVARSRDGTAQSYRDCDDPAGRRAPRRRRPDQTHASSPGNVATFVS